MRATAARTAIIFAARSEPSAIIIRQQPENADNGIADGRIEKARRPYFLKCAIPLSAFRNHSGGFGFGIGFGFGFWFGFGLDGPLCMFGLMPIVLTLPSGFFSLRWSTSFNAAAS